MTDDANTPQGSSPVYGGGGDPGLAPGEPKGAMPIAAPSTMPCMVPLRRLAGEEPDGERGSHPRDAGY